MLAILGFIVATIIFVVYGYSVSHITIRVKAINFKYFGGAYSLLGLACIVWALGSLINNPTALSVSVLVSDFILLAATMAIINSVLSNKNRALINILIAIGGTSLLVIRNILAPPDPYIKAGVLVFNSQITVAIILAIVFVVIWMPINLKVARSITSHLKRLPLQSISELIFVIASFSVVTFIMARRPITVALAFVILCCAFIPLIFINYLTKKSHL
jgi:hypothetical protein